MKNKSAALLAMLAGMGSLRMKEPADYSQRESNRMPLNAEELIELSKLSGKAKKQYVASLRNKYQSKTTIK